MQNKIKCVHILCYNSIFLELIYSNLNNMIFSDEIIFRIYNEKLKNIVNTENDVVLFIDINDTMKVDEEEQFFLFHVMPKNFEFRVEVSGLFEDDFITQEFLCFERHSHLNSFVRELERLNPYLVLNFGLVVYKLYCVLYFARHI